MRKTWPRKEKVKMEPEAATTDEQVEEGESLGGDFIEESGEISDETWRGMKTSS